MDGRVQGRAPGATGGSHLTVQSCLAVVVQLLEVIDVRHKPALEIKVCSHPTPAPAIEEPCTRLGLSFLSRAVLFLV